MAIRSLVGRVRCDGRDAETIGSDEFIHEERVVDNLLFTDQAVNLPQRFTWGGECRVEVDMNAKLLATGDEAMEVWGECRFYEGESTSSTDLEDTQPFRFVVPKATVGSQPIVNETRLVNSEIVGQDDWAIVRFGLKNRSAD